MEETLSNDERYQTLTEQSTHGDIIEVGGLTEHYNNLTLKTLYTLKFFLQEGKHYMIWKVIFFKKSFLVLTN